MRRRHVIRLIGLAAVWPLATKAELRSVARVGVLWHAASADQEGIYFKTLRKAFSDLGYAEGKNIEFEDRFPAEEPERFRIFADDLVKRKPDAIVAVTALGAKELQRLTSTIPVVFVIAADPVAAGFVDGLARPGRNMTGLSLMAIDLSGKRLELLKQAIGKLRRVGLLVDRIDPLSERFVKASQAAAKELGLSTQSSEAPTPDAIEQAYATFARDGVDGVVIGPGSKLASHRTFIGASSLKYKLPTLGPVEEYVPDGTMMSYGQDFPEFFRLALSLADEVIE